MKHLSMLLPLSLMATLVASSAYAAVDCKKIRSIDPRESFHADPDEVAECVRRGWDSPRNWRPNKGASPGVRVGGAGGFSYGLRQAPGAPPGAVNAPASLSRQAIQRSCSMPPRISGNIDVSNGSLSLSGACMNFSTGALKDKEANATPTPIPVYPAGSCPAEVDTTGLYGTKQPAQAGDNAATCGAMLPLSTTDLSFTVNPIGMATTNEGAYYLYPYKKSGGTFVASAQVPLPTYLCENRIVNGKQVRVKTVDLTPPKVQTITYAAGTKEIAIRLQSRETMSPNYIPPFEKCVSSVDGVTPVALTSDGDCPGIEVEDLPEKSLVVPIDAGGNPVVPKNCDEASTYFKVTNEASAVTLASTTDEGCTDSSLKPSVTFKCSTKNASPVPDANTGTQCYKGNSYTGQATPVWGCPAGTTLNTSNNTCVVAGVTYSTNCAAANAGANAEASCSVLSFGVSATTAGGTTDTSCANKTQFAVLDGPNLYYPPGTSAKLTSIQGRTALMAETVQGSVIYAPPQTAFTLRKDAPTVTLNDGGVLTLENGSTVTLNTPTTINPSNRVLTLTAGGQLVNSDGTLVQEFTSGATFTIPGSGPITFTVNQTLSLPPGYLLPTTATSPALRLPANAPQ